MTTDRDDNASLLAKVRPGARVRLRAEAPGRPKPFPRGWVDVEETLPRYSAIPEDEPEAQYVPTHIRVGRDARWIPVELIVNVQPSLKENHP